MNKFKIYDVDKCISKAKLISISPLEMKVLTKTGKSYSNIASERKVDSKFSIFIGSTSSPIEALERGVNVIHICDDPVFQRYSSTLWPSIKTKKIDENTFEYQLSKKGNLIQLGSNPKIFQEEYFN